MNYIITDNYVDGFAILQITEGKFKDTKFRYGSLKLEENEDHTAAFFQFDYRIVDGEIQQSDIKEFEELISEILNDMVFKQLEENSVIYAGGVNE